MGTQLTLCAVLEVLHFDTTTAPVASGVLRVFSHVLPREVRSETVHLRTVMSNEEDEVLGGKVPRPSAGGKRARLEDLPSPVRTRARNRTKAD